MEHHVGSGKASAAPGLNRARGQRIEIDGLRCAQSVSDPVPGSGADAQVNAVCDAAMRGYGMPECIRTDNGARFDSGDISRHKGRAFFSEVFRNQDIGLEQMDEDVIASSSAMSNWASSTARRCDFGR